MRKVNILFGGAYATRVSSSNSLGATSGYVGVGIVGLMVVGATTQSSNKDGHYTNCFAETVSDPLTGKKRVCLVKRPGWTTLNTPASGNIGNAILVWTGSGAGTDVITAYGAVNSTVYNSGASLGAITGKATGISETFVGTTPTLLVSSTDSTAWYYDTGVGVMTKITDADFPGNAGKTIVGTFANIDGYACIMTADGQVWASDLNSVTGWTANSYDSANSYADKGVGLIRHRNFIIAFGTESMQFFYNAGQTPFPFAKSSNMTLKVGAVSADAIAQISETTFWAGSTPQSGISIFQYDGSISRVSTPEIDSILILAGASNISLSTLRFYGRSFVYCRVSTQTYVYCVEEKMWHEQASSLPMYKFAALSTGSSMVTYAISKTVTSGKVYVQSHGTMVFTDDGMSYAATAQNIIEDFGTNARKFYGNLDIVGDVESGSSPLTVSYSDNDYATYTTWGTVDLSAQHRRLTRGGSSRRRAWSIAHSANTPMRIERAEVMVEVGTS